MTALHVMLVTFMLLANFPIRIISNSRLISNELADLRILNDKLKIIELKSDIQKVQQAKARAELSDYYGYYFDIQEEAGLKFGAFVTMSGFAAPESVDEMNHAMRDVLNNKDVDEESVVGKVFGAFGSHCLADAKITAKKKAKAKPIQVERYAECMAAMCYVKGGGLANMAQNPYRQKYTDRKRTDLTKDPKIALPFQMFLGSLSRALHRANRYQILHQLWRNQQHAVHNDKTAGFEPHVAKIYTPFFTRVVSDLKGPSKNNLLVWRGEHSKLFIKGEKPSTDISHYMYGPSSTSLGLLTAIDFARKAGLKSGTVFRIEIPINEILAKMDGKGTEPTWWLPGLDATFGSLDIEVNGYADSSHTGQRELLVEHIPTSWISVDGCFQKFGESGCSKKCKEKDQTKCWIYKG
eukprot:226102_1